MAPRLAILVVENEEVYIDFLQRFDSEDYQLVFASDLSEGRDICQKHRPKLIIVSVLDYLDNSYMLETLRFFRRYKTKVIGLSTLGKIGDELHDLLDRTVPVNDLDQLFDTTARLMDERRRAPRAQIDLPVRIGDLGELKATVVSGRTLFIPTDKSLRIGQMVQLIVPTGPTDLRCWATVIRANREDSKTPGLVLSVSAQAMDVRAYLSGLVRGALLLKHADQAGERQIDLLPPSVTQKLTLRMQEEMNTLKSTLHVQIELIDELNERLENLSNQERQRTQWKDIQLALERKWNAQRDLIKSIVRRVNHLAENNETTTDLKKALQAQSELYNKIEEQELKISRLRKDLEQISTSTDVLFGFPPQGDAHLSLEKKIAQQAALLDRLAARVEELTTISDNDRLESDAPVGKPTPMNDLQNPEENAREATNTESRSEKSDGTPIPRLSNNSLDSLATDEWGNSKDSEVTFTEDEPTEPVAMIKVKLPPMLTANRKIPSPQKPPIAPMATPSTADAVLEHAVGREDPTGPDKTDLSETSTVTEPLAPSRSIKTSQKISSVKEQNKARLSSSSPSESAPSLKSSDEKKPISSRAKNHSGSLPEKRSTPPQAQMQPVDTFSDESVGAPPAMLSERIPTHSTTHHLSQMLPRTPRLWSEFRFILMGFVISVTVGVAVFFTLRHKTPPITEPKSNIAERDTTSVAPF